MTLTTAFYSVFLYIFSFLGFTGPCELTVVGIVSGTNIVGCTVTTTQSVTLQPTQRAMLPRRGRF